MTSKTIQTEEEKRLVTISGPDAQKLLDVLEAGYSFTWHVKSKKGLAMVEIWEEQ
jgi:hypothetical protein